MLQREHTTTPPAPVGEQPTTPRRRGRTWWTNHAALTIPALIVAVMGYGHRWMSDDGLIYTRTVRQILAGHGPVLNPGERAEATTSAAWTWILATVSFVTRADPALVAVFLGLALTTAGFWLAADAAMRLHGRGRLMLPAGALTLAMLPPVWDFATSGLETGLAVCWIAASWRALVAARRAPTRRETTTAALLAGLGPLVRPDFTVYSAVLLATLWWLGRPPRRQLLRLTAIAGALPVGYEIFRAGYYGQLVPLPAVSKSAATGHWARGISYLTDFTSPYRLWVPLVLAAVLADQIRRSRRGRLYRPEAIATLAPITAGILSALYVVWIGGDFMHARMLLPALLMILLPVFVIPASRRTLMPLAILTTWALICGITLRVPYVLFSPTGISNERMFYVDQAAVDNPDTGAQHAAHDPETKAAAAALATGRRILVLPDGTQVPLRPDLPASFALAWPALGINGVVTPLDDDAVDPMGLGYPLAAHLQITGDGRPGHDRWIPDVWIIADYGDPTAPAPKGIDPTDLAAARHALSCGALAQLQASARAPMSFGRFMQNLLNSVTDTSVSFPADPVAAEHEFCR